MIMAGLTAGFARSILTQVSRPFEFSRGSKLELTRATNASGKTRTMAGKPKISLRAFDVPVYRRDRSGVARSLRAPGIRLFI